MPKALRTTAILCVVFLGAVLRAQDSDIRANAWLSWRGPFQNGTSHETNLPNSVSNASALAWSVELAGRGTPVVARGKLYCLGYEGERDKLQEMIRCYAVDSGKMVWEHRFTDFLSDSIYYRYAIGSPTVDPETGNVLCMSTAGLLNCFTAGGELLWQRSLMAEYGRLTFPNGRTGAPLIDGDLCIVHVISAAWGKHTPARDRFYAFDKKSGMPIWSCTPGGPPKDSSFSYPVLADEDGRRVLYAGLGGGHIVAVDVRTGDPLWRYPMSIGGINSSALLYKDDLIAIHGKENRDSSTIGRMIRLKRQGLPAPGTPAQTLTGDVEVWRNDLVAFTSSPVLVENRVYQTVLTGDLCCVDADSGEILWRHKLAPDQIHASPVWADGKLYVPMNNGTFHIVKPTDAAPELVDEVQLDGNCLGAPAIAGGRIFVHTTERLYCFGNGADAARPNVPLVGPYPTGAAARLQVVPGDILLRQGDSIPLRARSLDANGRVVEESVAGAQFSGMPAGLSISEDGTLTVASNAEPTAFDLNASAGDLQGASRIRIVPAIPFSLDIDGMQVGSKSPKWWVAAGSKWEVLDLEGDRVLARTLANPLFQRTMSLIGHPDSSNYTMEVDIRTDGNRRMRSSAGVVHQRYLIVLKGNHQELEVSSNMELLKVAVPFKWKAKTWYRMKTRVDVSPDGSGVVRAKVWPRSEAEPDSWTIEVPHAHAHRTGAPGLYGFTPQSRFRVYLDNVSVTSND